MTLEFITSSFFEVWWIIWEFTIICSIVGTLGFDDGSNSDVDSDEDDDDDDDYEKDDSDSDGAGEMGKSTWTELSWFSYPIHYSVLQHLHVHT